jgi:extracellular factor (EF) 3-hydroxypalmitic acid methyl ester biosynthesis protein
MQQNGHIAVSDTLDSVVTGKTNHGLGVQSTVLKLTRHQVVFEIGDPNCILRTSEVLTEFKIKLNDILVYSGHAVIASLINTGTNLICEAALKEGWIDVQPVLPGRERRWSGEFDGFVKRWQKNFKVQPEYKLAVADMQSLLADMRLWLDQVEFGLASQPAAERAQTERAIITELQGPILPTMGVLFEKFEASCKNIEPEWEPAYRSYIQRQLHSIVLCAPFMNRTFTKPLGYAGDYEMVSMMVRDPQEGSSMFAKVLNTFFLATPPVVAHRNRIEYLKTILAQEAIRMAGRGTGMKVFNLGCGPAKEIQDFIAGSYLSEKAQFTLLDFNKETLQSTGGILRNLIQQHHRGTKVDMVEKSIVQLLKDSARPNSALHNTRYDLVYCAGLFDYISDVVCQKLMDVFYSILAPGGLLVATNVDTANPAVNWMKYAVDWHLVYRNGQTLPNIMPTLASPDNCRIMSEDTGVNTFIEIRKPTHV